MASVDFARTSSSSTSIHNSISLGATPMNPVGVDCIDWYSTTSSVGMIGRMISMTSCNLPEDFGEHQRSCIGSSVDRRAILAGGEIGSSGHF